MFSTWICLTPLALSVWPISLATRLTHALNVSIPKRQLATTEANLSLTFECNSCDLIRICLTLLKDWKIWIEPDVLKYKWPLLLVPNFSKLAHFWQLLSFFISFWKSFTWPIQLVPSMNMIAAKLLAERCYIAWSCFFVSSSEATVYCTFYTLKISKQQFYFSVHVALLVRLCAWPQLLIVSPLSCRWMGRWNLW